MENLSKEGFWNELYEKYPEGMKVFCDWIDEYKKRVDWTHLFNAYGWDAPKYHDLPLEMQHGIFYKFIEETSDKLTHVPLEEWKNLIENYIRRVHVKEKVSDAN